MTPEKLLELAHEAASAPMRRIPIMLSALHC